MMPSAIRTFGRRAPAPTGRLGDATTDTNCAFGTFTDDAAEKDAAGKATSMTYGTRSIAEVAGIAAVGAAIGAFLGPKPKRVRNGVIGGVAGAAAGSALVYAQFAGWKDKGGLSKTAGACK